MRLHLTPFSKDLAQSLLSTHPCLAAESISYHTLETFPEHSYGYIELTAMEADKLKKKLNGSILKGKKLRVERARPQKRGFESEPDNGGDVSAAKQESRTLKRSKRSEPELRGHALAGKRRIKRGWTKPDKGNQMGLPNPRASAQVASKYTDKQECMFRVQLPLNKKIERSALTRDEKRQDKQGKKATVVHEFEKTVLQPSFIRRDASAGDVVGATVYIDGKGWMDKDGNIVEEESKRQLRSRSGNDQRRRPHQLKSTVPDIHHTSSTDKQDSNSDTERDGSQHVEVLNTTPRDIVSNGKAMAITEVPDDETSSSGTSRFGSDSSPESDEEPEQDIGSHSEGAHGKHLGEVANASEATPLDKAAVHPLEALFKRPNQASSQPRGKRPPEIKTTFNFFRPDEEQTIPQTPFTTHDLQLRGLRSAAPTPDTALPTRRFFDESASPCSKTGVGDEAELEGPSVGLLSSDEPKQEEGESEFAKWFWEHRGENNRAWKRRRRETMKEKRQRETRLKGRTIG